MMTSNQFLFVLALLCNSERGNVHHFNKQCDTNENRNEILEKIDFITIIATN